MVGEGRQFNHASLHGRPTFFGRVLRPVVSILPCVCPAIILESALCCKISLPVLIVFFKKPAYYSVPPGWAKEYSFALPDLAVEGKNLPGHHCNFQLHKIFSSCLIRLRLMLFVPIQATLLCLVLLLLFHWIPVLALVAAEVGAPLVVPGNPYSVRSSAAQ